MSEDFWQESRVSEIGTVITGGTPDTEDASNWGGHIPFATPGDFFGSLRLTQTQRTLTINAARSIGLFPNDSILVTCIGTIGKVKVTNCESVANQQINALICNKGYDPEFIAYSIANSTNDLLALAGTTTLPIVNGKSFGQLKIKYPTYSTQRYIAEILSTLDETIEQTEALIAKMQQVKAGLMHDLFTRGVTPDGRLRPTREQAPDLYKESPLGWIPKEWETASLADKARSGRPHLKTGPFGSSLKIEHWVEDGHPVITIGALGEGDFIHSELLFVSDVTAERLREYQLEVGDVVFSRVADVGRSAVILDDHKGWIMSSNLMRISLDQSKVHAAYLQSQLAHDARVRAQIRATVNSGGREVANSQILNRLLFAWPHPDEQARILDRVQAHDDKRKTESADLANLIKQKSGLMHDLLTGYVRVP